MPQSRFVSIFALIAAFVAGAQAQAGEAPGPARGAPAGPPDVIFITSITPGTVTHGEEVEIVARIAYQISTQDKATISLGFNSTRPQGAVPVVDTPVNKGTGEVELRARVVPRYWSELIPFNASVIMSVDGPGQQRRALASDHRKIPFVAGTGDTTTAPRMPKPGNVYENGIAITSIRPDVFKEGVEQEVIVTVKYELFSREEGEIIVTATNGRPNGSAIIGKALVKIGKGEIELRGKIVGRKTGNLPFAKVNAGMLEHPRGTRSPALAFGEITVPVE